MDLIQLVNVALGSAAGALFAFVVDICVRRRHDKNVEVSALNNLIVDLHTRRALAIWKPSIVDPAACRSDIDRTLGSVMGIRSSVTDTRRNLRPKSSKFEVLVDMTAACNRYLELAENDPSTYQHDLEDLNNSLSEGVKNLSTQKGVICRQPGQRAF